MALDNERSQVAHLLRRAGFGATEIELDSYTQLGFAGAVDRLLNPEQVDDASTDQLLQPLTEKLGERSSQQSAVSNQQSAISSRQSPGRHLAESHPCPVPADC